ncbi:hypothetical protein K525DRAFT_214444, partial [Schizophyllum commune Loenen D]
MRATVEEDPASRGFHWHPFTEYWAPPYADLPTQQVMGELYASESFRQAEKDLLASPPEPGCDLPRVVFSNMFWSDATHTSQFGDSKVWPGYAYTGNQSMYERSKPSAGAAHHFVYFPSLPDSFGDFLAKNDIKATAPLLAHCRRELFHGVWRLILDEDFMKAYKHGIKVYCYDKVWRRIYPRIFTYSADYPEKVLIATIRDYGNCPCTRCTVSKDQIRDLGSTTDRDIRTSRQRQDNRECREKVEEARKIIYDQGYAVTSEKVEEKLKAESYVP